MTGEPARRARAAGTLMVVVALWLIVAVVLGTRTHTRDVARLSDQGVTTQATVVERTGSRDVLIHVAFDTPDGRVVRRLREHDRGPQVGDRIPVTYDPADPAVVMPVSEVGYWRALPGLLLVLAVALGLGYLGLTVFLGDFPGLRHLTALWRARSPG